MSDLVIPPRRFCYGEVHSQGAIVFKDIAGPYLYSVFALSDGEIDSFVSLKINGEDVSVTGSLTLDADAHPYENFYEAQFTLGAPNQVNADFISTEFTYVANTFKTTDIARITHRMHYGDDEDSHSTLWGSGIDVLVRFKGMNVYDPREAGHSLGDATTWEYSDNPALCLAHFLINCWSLGIANTDIDFDTLETAADACDEQITFDSQTFSKFAISYVAMADKTVAATVEEMLACFNGSLTFFNGKYHIDADASRTAVWTISDDDITESIESFQHARAREGAPNKVKAKFPNVENGGVVESTEPYTDATLVTSDGWTNELTYDIPSTPTEYRAQILAYMRMQRDREFNPFQLAVNDIGLFIRPFEVVEICSKSAPFLDGTYEVIERSLADVGAILTLTKYASSAYDDPTTFLIDV